MPYRTRRWYTRRRTCHVRRNVHKNELPFRPYNLGERRLSFKLRCIYFSKINTSRLRRRRSRLTGNNGCCKHRKLRLWGSSLQYSRFAETIANAGVFFLRQRHARQFQRSQFDKPKWLACVVLHVSFFYYPPWYLSLALRKMLRNLLFFFRIATTAMIAAPSKKTGSQRHRVFNSINVTHGVATCQVKNP